MTAGSVRRRAGFVLALVITAFVVPFATPIGVAEACGCGAFDPAQGGTASVPAETALVRSAGGYEDIYLSLSVDTDVRSGALLFPVPDRNPVVTAGPRDLFDHLGALTAPGPSVDSSAPGNAGAARPQQPNVVVEKRQAIGPLDVVTLAVDAPGSSAGGAVLTRWLIDHGFSAKPALAAAASPYIAQDWAFVAVRLRPAVTASTLRGQLDPLHLRFRSAKVVYPMRLSHLAPKPEYVTVYTLAAHVLTLDTRDPGMSLEFAQRLSRAPYPELEPMMRDGARVLTRYQGTVQPATITDDFHFAADPADRALHQPSRHYATEENIPPQDTADHTAAIVGVGILGVVLLIVLVVGTVVLVRRRDSGISA